MKMEEFSGYKPEFILQDLYADMWMYNIVSLKIMEANEKKHLTQNEDGEYVIKRNFNKTLGTMRRYFLKVLMCEVSSHESSRLTNHPYPTGRVIKSVNIKI